MLYLIVEARTPAQLMEQVNDYSQEGWEPLGGLVAIRETMSGPITYFQTIKNNGDDPPLLSERGQNARRKKK